MDWGMWFERRVDVRIWDSKRHLKQEAEKNFHQGGRSDHFRVISCATWKGKEKATRATIQARWGHFFLVRSRARIAQCH